MRELEFPLSLVIWDAIFAIDNKDFKLVNYIFVALLFSLRDEILKSDNSSCMKLLMQPHFHLDPLNVLKTALYLYDPVSFISKIVTQVLNNKNENFLKSNRAIPVRHAWTTSPTI